MENKWLQRLGELSFIIFLTHQLIIRYSGILFGVLHVENKIIFVVFVLSFTIIVSVFVERYILNPITQWLTKKIQLSMTVRS